VNLTVHGTLLRQRKWRSTHRLPRLNSRSSPDTVPRALYAFSEFLAMTRASAITPYWPLSFPILVSAKQTFWVKARLSKPCWLVLGCYGRLIQSRMIQVSQIAQALDIHGLIIYLAGMTFIFGALVFANHADDQRDKIKRRSVSRASC
jgi:hypothetical protein